MGKRWSSARAFVALGLMVSVVGCEHSVLGTGSESSAITVRRDESCDASWGEPAGGYDGAEGTFHRAGDASEGEMKTMMLSRLAPDPSGPIAIEADSVRTFECSADCRVESGRAQLLPVSPALDATLSFSVNGFPPPDGARPDIRDSYSVLAIERGPDGRVAAFCLSQLGYAPGQPFVMRR